MVSTETSCLYLHIPVNIRGSEDTLLGKIKARGQNWKDVLRHAFTLITFLSEIGLFFLGEIINFWDLHTIIFTLEFMHSLIHSKKNICRSMDRKAVARLHIF